VISDSPEKDDDAHSWDDDVRDAEREGDVADVIAFAAEANGEGLGKDDDPWDSEDDEPTGKTQQPGPSEGQGVDPNSWDSEDESETKLARRRGKEDVNMQDLDDLVGEVLDGQKRIAIHEHLADFRCTKCDHAVIRFTGFEWAPEVDYLSVRNYHGKPEKLRSKLNVSSGSTAYCCQCCTLVPRCSSPYFQACG
jgi:hypothetical protein